MSADHTSAARRNGQRSDVNQVLTLASLGLLSYGLYSIGWAFSDMVRGRRLELWAELGAMIFGLLLAVSAAFVRVKLPGGLAFAVGALLALQGLAVHSAVHLGGGVIPQLWRAAFAILLVALAYTGSKPARSE